MLPKAWVWLKRYNEAKARLVIGLISGTSADGIDAALVKIVGKKPDRVETIAFTTLPYPKEIRETVLSVSQNGDTETLCWLNFALGELFAEAALEVGKLAQVSMKRISLIGSHGQTVRHLPPQFKTKRKFPCLLKTGSTLQITSPAVIAARTGVPVVSDFRSKDMALGGQGAPLVPLVDWLLLCHPKRNRVALNIGGIANLTVLPVKAKPNEIFAFDTGPGNMLIDGFVKFFSQGKMTFDKNGEWASKGKVNDELLIWLMSHPFILQKPPKSTGRETFGESFLGKVLKRASKFQLSEFELVATLTAFTAESIAYAIKNFVLPKIVKVDELIVSGGGSNNPTLMKMLSQKLNTEILRSDEFGINADSKEAVAFAVLAHRTVVGLIGNLPSATGATSPTILGSITLP
ncbi:MAG: anhydro-N-acetylmuramic acid kinase [Armatimonadetes bacterium]|nr:anhydro-N-acetylmuramic acid kinase [Armatimonadota bacterium]MDW8028111.1 anhydro-N-acetylmuramic acid kinase [Armatimonadota bacterium]